MSKQIIHLSTKILTEFGELEGANVVKRHTVTNEQGGPMEIPTFDKEAFGAAWEKIEELRKKLEGKDGASVPVT